MCKVSSQDTCSDQLNIYLNLQVFQHIDWHLIFFCFFAFDFSFLSLVIIWTVVAARQKYINKDGKDISQRSSLRSLNGVFFCDVNFNPVMVVWFYIRMIFRWFISVRIMTDKGHIILCLGSVFYWQTKTVVKILTVGVDVINHQKRGKTRQYKTIIAAHWRSNQTLKDKATL